MIKLPRQSHYRQIHQAPVLALNTHKEGQTMKNIQLSALIIAAALSLASCSGGGAPSATDPCTTAGTCKITVNLSGVSGATLSVQDADGNTTSQTVTSGQALPVNKSGNWTLTPQAQAGFSTPAAQTFTISSSNKTPTGSFSYVALAPTAPAFQTVSPANNAVCVRDDAKLVIDFDQPMQNTTGTFFTSSSGLTLGSQSWSNGGKTLTVNLNGLSYSTAPGAPNTYSFTITNNGFVGAGGLGLSSSPMTRTFKTCVKYSDTIKSDSALNQNLFLNPVAAYTGLPMTFGADSGRDVVSLLTFKLNPLPAAVTQDRILSATLRVHQQAITGGANDPFTQLGLGSSDIFELWNLSYPAAVTTSHLSAASKVTGNMTAQLGNYYDTDILTQLKVDVQGRASNSDRSQYMLRFAKSITSGSLTSWLRVDPATANTLTTINLVEPRISVDYLLDN